ncbi:MAG: GGDEF domain-containing protein [Patescibacteria group bacterium]|nr:GGDEF domain-containing protein [Patescibacteria group bacterium]MDE1946167.1 GGDEF domain-containing protein [Patescibacteria group bacterium]
MAQELSAVDRLKMFFQVVGLQKENIQLKKRIAELEQDIIHDGLTGLKTRRYLNEELERNLTMIFQADHHLAVEHFGFTKVSVLFFDIDNFKKINDKYGHGTGDDVLKAVARVLKRNVWKRDLAARYGGEEMAMMLLGSGEEDAYKKAEDIRKKIGEIKIPDYPKIKVTVSIGVAQADSASVEQVVKNADVAMYEAKFLGKNRTIRYSELLAKKKRPAKK